MPRNHPPLVLLWLVLGPAATVSATRFELLRASSGRRTADEIARYEWDPRADAQLLLASTIFSLPAQSLRE